jgi:hypothetical protein
VRNTEINRRLHVKMQYLVHRTIEMQVTECFGNFLFSICTHFAVDSALLEEFSFPQLHFIFAAHIICKRVSHRSWAAVTGISRLQFAIQSLGHCGCTMHERNRARRSVRMHSAPMRAPPRAAPRARAPLRAYALNAAPVRMCPNHFFFSENSHFFSEP